MIRLDGQAVQLTSGRGQAYGMSYTTIVTTTGNWHIMHNAYFDSEPSLANSVRVVNLKSLDLKYLCNRKHVHTDYDGAKGDLGTDALGGDWLSEYSFRMYAPQTNGIIYNLCKAGCRPPCIYTKWEPLELCKDECGRVVPVLNDEDGRLLYAGEYNDCPFEGLDPEFPKPEPCKDKCGNLVCPPDCDEVAAYWCHKCEAISTIHTTEGDIDFNDIDFLADDAAELATTKLNEWMNEGGRTGEGTITIKNGITTVKVTTYTGFEFLETDPVGEGWQCNHDCGCSTEEDND